jgi:hypothetical protein
MAGKVGGLGSSVGAASVKAAEASSDHDVENRAILYAFSISFKVLPSRLFQLVATLRK